MDPKLENDGREHGEFDTQLNLVGGEDPKDETRTYRVFGAGSRGGQQRVDIAGTGDRSSRCCLLAFRTGDDFPLELVLTVGPETELQMSPDFFRLPKLTKKEELKKALLVKREKAKEVE